ncbi:hypothetical protein IWX90DRAFT_166656 [Phyllosticta citrichinensis]|uniref:Rhodopsin domain-containing protein n=1 Tax=Phyllosticta citrichinensis TaxID=1130410 RepID=A0ABR1Y179_9PEZI
MSSDYSSANATTYNAKYDPSRPVTMWRHRLELGVVCTCNALSFMIMVARLYTQRRRFGRFRKAELWTLAATIILVFPFWTSQIMTNHFGGGKHIWSIPPEDTVPFWKWEAGWAGHYIVVSMVKVSMCYGFLEMLPEPFRRIRMAIHILAAIIIMLGFAESLVWLFQCTPFMANFDYDVQPVRCANIDNARYSWAGLSIAIDIALIYIPISILHRTRLKDYERRILYMVFGASLVGTVTTAAGVYGIWKNRVMEKRDMAWSEVVFVMFNAIEILMYTIGGSIVVLSRYFIAQAAKHAGTDEEDFTPSGSWTLFDQISPQLRSKKDTTTSTVTVKDDQQSFDDYSINAVKDLSPRLDLSPDGFDPLRPLPPPDNDDMATMRDPKSSRWNTWEKRTVYHRSNSPASKYFKNLGILPDTNTPPHTPRIPLPSWALAEPSGTPMLRPPRPRSQRTQSSGAVSLDNMEMGDLETITPPSPLKDPPGLFRADSREAGSSRGVGRAL